MGLDDFQEHAGMEEHSDTQPPVVSSAPQESIVQQSAFPEGLSTLQSPPQFTPTFSHVSVSNPGILEQPGSADFVPGMMDFTPRRTDSGNLPGSAGTSGPSQASTNGWMSSLQLEQASYLGGAVAVQMSDLMKADLNHLYFDRVHLFAPILNKRRYFARAARPTSTTAPLVGLQHAMWTLAAWLGSQFKDIQKELYSLTRVMLEAWELDILTESPPIEQAQAWILLAIYEIMQVNYHRGWLSAGRAFRIVQLMKLHQVDVPNEAIESNRSHVEVEERRRTFWMAYSLDRIINLLNQMPLTLNEQVVGHHSISRHGLFMTNRMTDSHSPAGSRNCFSA